jgi:hypothetical protein
VLFKQGEAVQNFNIDELFMEKSISTGLVKVEQPDALKMTPNDIYKRIREIASKRYGYELPEKQSELRCLQNQNNKISLLRDLCQKIGV